MAGNRDDLNCHEEDGNAIELEKLSLGPDGSKKLLVLDLAGVLCDRVFHKNRANIPDNRTPDDASGSFFVYKRPFCEEFVRFCLERFDVGIWSSAKRLVELHLPRSCLMSLLDAISIIQKFTRFSALNMRNRTNLETALDCVIGEFKGRLLFVWVGDQIRAYAIKIAFGYRYGRTEEALSLSLITKENKNKPIFFKELKKLWDNKSSNLPWRKGQYSSSNTLLIDDKPYKALLNPPCTAIFPTEYRPDQLDDATLGPNGELRRYLDGLARAADVPAYVKEHPFGQSAITATHPDWDFYSNIIDNSKGEE
ncbi:hypothetical protein POTOM_037052 [Populus tomentosa]|uniref:Mitochondrial import inner membrane translocase subunit TIM50 n=1 Tax=Populus tomentosa TaxID=118781 RepID=A0A8X7Z009_POPTO|nr:hypothetical protein POTOM_037052 [Populus tomentosa]